MTIVETPEQTVAGERRETEERQHESADLDAQVKAANAATRQVGPSWLGAMLSFAGTLLIVWTLFETRKANRISSRESARSTRRAIAGASETAEALKIARLSAEATAGSLDTFAESNRIASEAVFLEQRAWLYPKIKSFEELLFSDSGAQIQFTYSVENMGRTHGAILTNYAVLASSDLFYYINGLEEAVTSASKAAYSTFIFPMEYIPDFANICSLKEASANSRKSGDHLNLTILIYIFYQTAMNKDVKYTVRSFDIHDTNEYGGLSSIKYGENLTGARIRYSPGRHGNVAT